MTLWRLRFVRLVPLCLLFLSACGGSDDAEGSTAGLGGGGLVESGGSVGIGGARSGGTSAGGSSAGGGSAGGTSGAASGGTGAVAGTGILECESYDLGECGSTAEIADLRPVNILIVFDKSGSMGSATTNTETKWQAATASLDRALDILRGHAQFGFQFFPDKDVPMQCSSDCCAAGAVDVPIGPGETTVPQISSLILADALGPGGFTPTAAALSVSYDYLEVYLDGFIEGDGGETFVFLITDGGPNCNSTISCGIERCTANMDLTPEDPGYFDSLSHNFCADPSPGPLNCLDDAETIDQIERIATLGVKTVVIGVPGSEVYGGVLTQMAVAGGARADYYRVSDPGSLERAFVDIASDLITSCEIRLDEAPPDLDKLNVAIDCGAEPRLGPAGEERWRIDSSVSPPELILLGDLCTKAETAGLGRLDVLFGCPSLT